MVVHGLPKIKNLKGAAAGFEKMGFKPGNFWAVIAIFVELVGGLGLILGFLTQFFALLIALQFAVILIKFKLRPGSCLADGYEFDLLIFAAALALATLGSGALSLDSYLGLIIY